MADYFFDNSIRLNINYSITVRVFLRTDNLNLHINHESCIAT
ncbi:hypothetical protein C3B55_00809 [Candidatus Pseudomonas adelgestsugas]|uniref:Uncharacterized protein n=1 Tax=Candidatus Pseudomonas adelgestsugas TaxID=1302376 RepID=A0ABX5R8Z6_9PSED|nr:hypothetical protein C3B55_00809 [Candidatus Pseudomonas adelgestsugas]